MSEQTPEHLPRYEAALLEYREAIRLNPADPLPHVRLGQIYLAQKQLQQAKDCFQQALTLDENHVEAQKSLAKLYFVEKKYTDSVTLYQKILKQNYHDAQTHFDLGLVHFEMGHSDLFLQSCAKALSVDPLFAKAYFAEGALYSKLGKSDLAIKALKKGLKISDSDSKAHFALAKIYREQGNEEACIFEAMETIKHNPAHVGAHFFLGEILYKHGDYALALKKFNECLKLHSGLASLHNLQALCFRKVEYRLLEELKKNSSQQKIEEIAAFYFENQKYEMAISFLERLRRSYPHNQNVVMKLSQVYQHLNHWQQAYTCLKEFFNAQPHNSEMKALVKQAYLDYERHLQNNILKQPRAHESRVQLIHLYLMEERSLEALEEYLRYLDIFPADHLQKSNMQKIMQVIQEQNEKLKTLPDTHAIVAFRVAHLAMARGQYQQAYAVFEKLLASYPQDQGMLYGLIRSAYHEKQYEQALKTCRQLKKINANYRYANQIEAEILKNQKNQTSESSKVDINQ